MGHVSKSVKLGADENRSPRGSPNTVDPAKKTTEDPTMKQVSGSLFLEYFSDWWSVLSTAAAFLNASPVMEGLQQWRQGCDGRQVQAQKLSIR